MSWHLSCQNIKCHSWISLSCLDTWTVAHMFLLSVSFGLWSSGKSLLWWQPFLHVIAEDSADVHKYKKGTCHTESQNWCFSWAGFHYCNSLVCEAEKQLLWIVCIVDITVNMCMSRMCMTINSRQVMSSRKSALDVFICPFSVQNCMSAVWDITGITSVLVTRFYLGNQIQEGEIGRAYDVWGRREMH